MEITEIGENKFKLSLKTEDERNPVKSSSIESHHIIEEFDIWLEIESDNEVQQLKKLYQAHGSNVKKLTWINWCNYEMSAAEIIEMLNYFPKLEFLKLSSWSKKFTGDVGELHLPNLKRLKISSCNNFMIDFLSTALPENSIEDLTLNETHDIDEKLCNFVSKQTSIKRLNVHADLKTVEPLTHLKLDFLRCILYHHDDELEDQRKFLQTLIKSQVNLTTLDLFNESDYSFSFITDEIFADICALSKLENLSVSVDSLTLDGIKPISNLSALKHLNLKVNKTESLEILREFSAIKLSSLESLVLSMWNSIPTEIVETIGENYKNLKSLGITLDARERISFYAKIFPNLESLSIKFGEANNTIDFNDVYDMNDEINQTKWKNLNLNFCANSLVNTEAFFKLINGFKYLEKLGIDSKFPFTADFINQLANNLNSINSLKLHYFEIKNEENFPTEIIDALKLLRTKLNTASLLLFNVEERTGCCSKREIYQPIMDALKDIYKLRECSFANIRVYRRLTMEVGDWD